MPYARCGNCGILSYVLSRELDRGCPDCGAPLLRSARATIASADPDRRLDALVSLTRDLLDADAALLCEIRDGREIAVRVAGDWPQVTSRQGSSLPLEDTFCQRMLDGRIGNYIRDTAADERVRDLVLAHHLGVKSWLGVPIRPSDAQLYVLCCLAREAKPSLGERDLRLLGGLGESVLVELQRFT